MEIKPKQETKTKRTNKTSKTNKAQTHQQTHTIKNEKHRNKAGYINIK